VYLIRQRESAANIRNRNGCQKRESAGFQISVRRYSEEIMAKNLSNLRAPKKANTGRKRVGRGMGSGMGKTSARGHKGQGSRSGFSLMRGFEGGQMPLHRRLPKRGFTNIFRTEYTVVNLDRLAARIDGLNLSEIVQDDYIKIGLSSSKKALIKILGSGELTSALTIHAHKFSKSAVEKIEKAGGKAVLLGGPIVPDAPKTKLQKKAPKAVSKN
jgi:large subunit ribosomal protein L15